MKEEKKFVMEPPADTKKAVKEGLSGMSPLVAKNWKVVDECVNMFKGQGLDDDDLYQVASIAMWEAAKTYNANNAASFKTYATVCIKNAIMDALNNDGRTISFSKDYKEFLKKESRAIDKLNAMGNLYPSNADIASSLGMKEETYRQKTNAAKECNSWDEYDKASQDWTSHQEDCDIYADSEYSQSKTDLALVIKAMEKVLNSTDFEIMCELLGIETDNGNITVVAEKTSDELGKKYGISGQAIREKHAKFIKKMRDYFGLEYKELLR